VKADLVYTGIRVKNLEESIRFYTRLLGMKIKHKFKIDATKGTSVVLASQNGQSNLELNYYERDSPYYSEYTPGAALDHIAFGVDDLDDALAEFGSVGHPTVLEMSMNRLRWAYIEDPNGIWIELFSRGASSSARKERKR
jgi:lactoylglutathione lyase